MVTVVQEDNNLLKVGFEFNYPEWMNELTDEEFENIMDKAADKLINAFAKTIRDAQEYWRDRRKQELEGQTNIYDYV